MGLLAFSRWFYSRWCRAKRKRAPVSREAGARCMANEERRDPGCRGPRLYVYWLVEAPLVLAASHGPNYCHDYSHKDESGNGVDHQKLGKSDSIDHGSSQFVHIGI